MTIKIQSPENKGKFNLRTIEVGEQCNSLTENMHNGVTDKGRKVYVKFFDDGTVGVKDIVEHPYDSYNKAWNNVYNII